MTYVGIIAIVIAWIAKLSGVEITDASTQQIAENILTLVGILVAFLGRYRAGGIKWFGARKPLY